MAAADTFPTWIYDGSEIPDPFGHGERAVRFLRALRHPKAPGGVFTLDPWQERIVRRIYGPRRPDGARIVKTVVLVLPRGSRKTSFAAALALLHTVGPEREPMGEVTFAAADRKQARIAYNEAIGLVRATKEIGKTVSIQSYQSKITSKLHGSWLEAISCDAGTQNGRSSRFILVDELHAWKKRDLWDVLKSSRVKNTEPPLIIIATTAGRGQNNIAFERVDYARKVARGDVEDPTMLPVLFETDPDADWTDEAVWRRANPGLNCSPPYQNIDEFRQLVREALESPTERDGFRQLNLNVWLDYSEAPFVEMAIYDEGAEPAIDLEKLEDRPCWLAVDLASNEDLTAIVACWRDSDAYIVHPWFFCPEDNLRGRADHDGVPYPRWAEDGFITPTPGNVVDFRIVEDSIRDLCDRFDVQEIAFDPHMGRNMMSNLAEDGFPAIEMRQGWVTMAPAIKELERAIIGRQFRHGGHPILRWHFANIAVETDKAGNKSFHKGKSRDRIDGAVATAMAVGRASAGSKKRYSIYSDPKIRPEDLWI